MHSLESLDFGVEVLVRQRARACCFRSRGGAATRTVESSQMPAELGRARPSMVSQAHGGM